MSFTDEAVRAKLSALHDTQDSIVTVAQWIMFHRRYADRTANLWMQKLKDSNPAKRLNLIYLANEVVQQSKMKKREEFLNAFTPIIVESVTEGYRGAPIEIQGKIRRVVDVWRQRLIFEPSIQDALEASIDAMEKSRPATQRKALGGSLFPTDSSASNIPASILPIVTAQQSIDKTTLTYEPGFQTAEKDLTVLNTGAQPSPPLLAARLSALSKAFASAGNSLTELIATRTSLTAQLEKLLADSRTALAADEQRLALVRQRRADTEARKTTVEDAIMRGLAVPDADSFHGAADVEAARPDVERFTPPPADGSTTPPGYPGDGASQLPERESFTPPPPVDNAPAVRAPDAESMALEPVYKPLTLTPPPLLSPTSDPRRALDPRRRLVSKSPVGPTNGEDGAHGPPPMKKRKASSDEDFFAGDGGALEGLDAEVVGMLG